MLLLTQWTRLGQGFIIVYSITERASFKSVETLLLSIRQIRSDKFVAVLVGNHCDKSSQREVFTVEGAALAQIMGCKFLETSAKTGRNVQKVFTDLVLDLQTSALVSPNSVEPATLSVGDWLREQTMCGGDCVIA